MNKEKVAFVIFEGGEEARSEIEEIVSKARQILTLEQIEKALTIDKIDEIILFSNSQQLVSSIFVSSSKIKVELKIEFSASFHFGEELKCIINSYHPEYLFYIGGGAIPLIQQSELRELINMLVIEKNCFLTNNLYSSDIIGFAPADIINSLEQLPATDNALALELRDKGLSQILLEPSATLLLDIDTPIDLAILSLHPRKGKRIEEYLAGVSLPLKKLELAQKIMADRDKEAFIYGRVGNALFSFLNQNTRCRLRLLSEERSMRALGRLERREVISLLGMLLEQITPRKFFKQLSKFCNLAFIDTRVLLAHSRRQVSSADRFYSDIGEVDKIEDEYLKEITYCAEEAEIPVVLGGHSLVSGGLWALVESAFLRTQGNFSLR